MERMRNEHLDKHGGSYDQDGFRASCASSIVVAGQLACRVQRSADKDVTARDEQQSELMEKPMGGSTFMSSTIREMSCTWSRSSRSRAPN